MIQTRSNWLPVWFFVCCSLILFYCSGGGDSRGNMAELNQKVREFLEDNEGISAAECSELQALIATDPGLQADFASTAELEAFINEQAERLAKRRTDPIDAPVTIACSAATSGSERSGPISYNFYIENSGSMYGYLGGNNAFDDVVLGLMTKINRYDEELNMHFVNNKIHPVEAKLTDFMDYLSPARMRSIGNTGSSDLADVIRQVVEQQKEDDKTAILISDFIFSIKNHANVRSELTDQKYGITNIIHDNRLKERGLGFLIMKFSTAFKGNYYRYDNSRVNLDGPRPYYVWVIGPVDLVKSFVTKYEVNELKGFEQSVVIYGAETEKAPYYTILNATELLGDFDLDRSERNNWIRKIQNVSYNTRGERLFQFAIAFDASSFPVEEDYLVDKDNFMVSSGKEDPFEIVDVVKITSRNVQPNDRRSLESATHYAIIQAKEVSVGEQQLELSMLKRLPVWIAATSTQDDLAMGEGEEGMDKTFGLQDLIDGVAEEYSPKAGKLDLFFTVSVTLER